MHKCLPFAQNFDRLARLLSFTAETFQIIVFLPNFPVENVVVSVSCQTVRPVSGVQPEPASQPVVYSPISGLQPEREKKKGAVSRVSLWESAASVVMMNNCQNYIPLLGLRETPCLTPSDGVVVVLVESLLCSGGAGVTVTVPSAACLTTTLTCLSSHSDPERKTSILGARPCRAQWRINIDNEREKVCCVQSPDQSPVSEISESEF